MTTSQSNSLSYKVARAIGVPDRNPRKNSGLYRFEESGVESYASEAREITRLHDMTHSRPRANALEAELKNAKLPIPPLGQITLPVTTSLRLCSLSLAGHQARTR